MREIKFRFWDGTTGNKCMARTAEDGYITYSSGYRISMNQAIAEANITNGYDKPKALMQYTGLKDKNGVEVYEGDIIQRTHHQVDTDYDDGTFVVEWEVFGFKCRPLDGSTSRLVLTHDSSEDDTITTEVIGNIYENPELLTNSNKSEEAS